MKKYLLLISISFYGFGILAQNVGINGTGASPDPSAMLDVSAFNKGILIPRTSTVSRIAIASPAKGLMVYDTTTSSFWFHDGSDWNEIPKGSVGSGGTNYWSLKNNNIHNNNSGHVGIGTDTAQEMLTVQTADLQRGFSHRGENGKILTSFMGDTFAEFATLENTDLYLGAGGFPHIIISGTTGNVGINTTNPKAVLQVGETGLLNSGYDISFGNGSNGSGLVQGDESFWAATTDINILPKYPLTGTVNINTREHGKNKLQVGDMGTAGFNGNDIAFGNGTQAGALAQTNTIMQFGSSTDMNFIPQLGSGHVGINSTYPISNKLQIGNTGGFNGNDIAFGNAGQVTGIAQTANILQIGTTTDISILPQYGSNHGRVGINTGSPLAILDVASYYTVPALSGGYSYLYQFELDGDHDVKSFLASPSAVPNISILTQGNIYCNELDVYSDLRIKNLIGTSDASKDLASVNAIQIRDYTMKDKLKYGNRHFKKVIAQELEKVYPDLVSKHTDFIPNVYQITDTVTAVAGGYLLHFRHAHHLSDTAHVLKVLLNETGILETMDILSVPSANDVMVRAKEIKNNHVFVYGEEVNDFRTVDYEGLTTLNISATQEICRTVNTQAETISNQQKEIDMLFKKLSELEKHSPRKAGSVVNKGDRLAIVR